MYNKQLHRIPVYNNMIDTIYFRQNKSVYRVLREQEN